MEEYMKMMEEMQKKALEAQAAAMEAIPPDAMAAYQAQLAAQMEALAGFNPGAMIAGAMDELFGDEMSDEELDEFLHKHALPPEKACYIPIGAMLIGTQGEPYETLALTGDREEYVELLEMGWGIEGREEAIEMMESLLKGRHARRFHDTFMALKNGVRDEMSEEYIDDYETTIEGLIDALELTPAVIDKCDTLLGWDLERVGYLARILTHVGYIEEKEAWNYMNRAATLLKMSFDSCEAYFVSILIGRGLAMGVAPEPFAVALDLLTDSRAFLEAHPIEAM